MTDTDWLALADFLDAHANDMRSWTEDEPKFRATAEGLRQLDAITAERDQLRAERTQLTGDSMTDLKMTYAYEAGHEDGKAEVREQLAAITAAIGDLHRPMWDDPTAPGFYQTEPHREGDPAIGCCTCGTDGWPCPTAASLSPTPTPQHCPTCGRPPFAPTGSCRDPWHDSGQP